MSEEEKPSHKVNPRTEKAEVELPAGSVVPSLVCRIPSRDDWDAYLLSTRKNGSTVSAKELLLLCAEDISDADLEKVFEAYPALPESYASSLDDMAGGDVEVEKMPDAVTARFSKTEQYTFHAPNQPDYDALNKSMKKDKPGPTMRVFLERCYEGPGLDDMFDRYPASLGPIIGALRGIAGASFEVKVKKG
jgi:hypothetical protein